MFTNQGMVPCSLHLPPKNRSTVSSDSDIVALAQPQKKILWKKNLIGIAITKDNKMKRNPQIQILAVLIASQLLVSCAPITKKETLIDLERRSSFQPDPEASTTDVAGNCIVQEKSTILCSYNYTTTGKENEVEFVRQKKIVSKKANVPLQIIYYGLGGAALGFGGTVTLKAHNNPKKNVPNDDYKFSRNNAYLIGIGSMALGAVLTAVGIAGSARAKDTVETLPPQTHVIGSREVEGQTGAWGGKPVKVFAADSVVYTGKTDETGKISFAIESLFANSLPLQHGVVNKLRIQVEGAADKEIAVSQYQHHMCGVEAKEFGATTPAQEYRSYFEGCNKEVSWLTANSAWISAASLYGDKIDRECANIATQEKYENCETMYLELRKQLPYELINPEGNKKFITAYEKFKRKQKKKGRTKR